MATRALSTFHQTAFATLDSSWAAVLEIADIEAARHPQWGQRFYSLISTGGRTYPYVLLTQLLGKACQPKLNAKCLQDSSPLPGAWDARSLASKVVTPWNKRVGSPLPGGNTDPYVNNPARSKNFGPEMLQKAKSRTLYQVLDDATTLVEERPEIATELLIATLVEVRRFLEATPRAYTGPARASLVDVVAAFEEFLSQSSGGTRLQILVYALLNALNNAFPSDIIIKSYPVNASDAVAGRAGDVEKIRGGHVITAVEVKERSIGLAEIETTITKARTATISDILFVVHAHPSIVDEESEISPRLTQEFARGIDVTITSAIPFFEGSLTLLSPEQRAALLRTVHTALEELRADYRHMQKWLDIVRSM